MSPTVAPSIPNSRIAKSTAASVSLAGFAGGVWGLALARALAENNPHSPTFELGATLVVAAAMTVVAMGVDWWIVRRRGVTHHETPVWNSALVPLLLAAIYVVWPGVAPHVGGTLLGGSLVLTLFLLARQSPRLSSPDTVFPFNWLVVISLLCIVMALFLRTLGSSVGQADTFEFQVVAPKLGVAHPTGYPLYILIGKLFSLLPLGSVAWRINLTSAFFGTVAVLFLYHIVRGLTGRPLVALIAALALALSRVFWSQAVVAEVYTLHSAFVATVLLLLLQALSSGEWLRRTRIAAMRASAVWRVRGAQERLPKPVYFLSLMLGLSFANHLTTALLLPAVMLTLLFVRPRLSWREWLTALGLFLLGLAFYLYILLRWPMLHNGVWMSLGEFVRYVTGQQFGGALRLDAWRTDFARYQTIARLLHEPFGWPGLAMGAVGLVWLALAKWRVAAITLVTFLAYAWYALSYYVPDVSVFLLPAHLVLALWLGAAMATVLELRERLVRILPRFGRAPWKKTSESQSGALLISLFALFPLWLLWTNLAAVDQSGDSDAYVWGDRVLDLPLAPGAAILADSVRIAPLYYLQRIEGRRSDLDMLVLADERTYRAELENRLANGQIVYLARFLPGLEGAYYLRSVGPLTEVGVAPQTKPPPLDRSIGVRFTRVSEHSATDEEGVELLGLVGPQPGPDGGTGLTLYWRSDVPLGEVYHVGLRLTDGSGQVWWQQEGRHPANNYYPTSAWRSGEVVADYHEIPPSAVGPGATSKRYTLQVGLFRSFSDEGLLAEDGETWYPLIELDFPNPATEAQPIHPLRARFDLTRATALTWGTGRPVGESREELMLLGVDLPDLVVAGGLTELRLHTAATANGRPHDGVVPARPFLTWIDRHGNRTESPILEAWELSRVSLESPRTSGDYELRLGLMDVQGQSFPVRCGWLALPTQECTLATVQVIETTAMALANFGGRILLLDATLGVPTQSDSSVTILSPGQTIRVALGWQGLRMMEQDYTISVQLVGPDGRLYGQMDAWPVQGTYPTSQWSPGQRVADSYRVGISSGAPPGRYRVGVVVYLLATQTRLPLVDDSGRTTGDIAWVGAVEVVRR